MPSSLPYAADAERLGQHPEIPMWQANAGQSSKAR